MDNMTERSGLPPPAIALRMVRTAQGLSLRDLAARTGIPFSTLSKLENGKMAMTYDKLVLVAQGLGVDLGVLVAGEEPAPRPPAIGRRSVTRAGEWLNADSAKHEHHYPASDLLGKLMVPVIIDVVARSAEEVGGLVRHSGEEYLYVVCGKMELHTDLYAPLVIDEGDSVYFDSGMAHAYVNVGEGPCRVISVCAGQEIERFAQFARKGDGVN